MPVLTTDSLSFASESLDETVQIGAHLGKVLAGGDVICLSGDLGAGKTALASGIGNGWGAKELINSPTFVFVHEHHRAADAMRLFHVDCYRLGSIDEAETIGLEEILAGDDLVVIEWPEQIAPVLPPDRLWITLEAPGESDERALTFQADGGHYVTLLNHFRRSMTGG